MIFMVSLIESLVIGKHLLQQKLLIHFVDIHIEHVKISSTTPRANGQVERLNSTILSCTVTSMSDMEGTRWDETLSEVQWAINNAIHSVTKRTPSSLVYAYEKDGIRGNPLTREIREINIERGIKICNHQFRNC